MESTNINDPTAVRALLDQLRASQAWQDTLSSVDVEHPLSRASTQRTSVAAPPASVASLLSQLRPSTATTGTPPHASPTVPRSSQDVQLEHPTPRPASSCARAQDLRSVSFQQALPRLTQLAGDPGFLADVSRLRQEQNELEQKLWEERQAIHKKHEERAKVARTKATLIGAGLSKHEANMMNDAYRRDLEKFDRERMLHAWDAQVQKQQAALEALGVPTMFTTTSQADCQKQRRVVQVLEGL